MSKKRPTQYTKGAATARTRVGAAATSRPPATRAYTGPRRRRRQRRTAAFSVIAAIVLIATVTLAFLGHSSSTGYQTTASDWSLPTLGGGPTVTLASLKGRPTVVNFFASWCQVCASELPVFARDALALRGRVNVVEVNALETGNGDSFAKHFNLFGDATAVLRDVGGSQGDGLFESLGGSTALPMTAFYDANGHLITTHVGGYDAATLGHELKSLYGVAVPL